MTGSFAPDLHEKGRIAWEKYVAQMQHNAAPDSPAMRMKTWDELEQWIRDEWAEDALCALLRTRAK